MRATSSQVVSSTPKSGIGCDHLSMKGFMNAPASQAPLARESADS